MSPNKMLKEVKLRPIIMRIKQLKQIYNLNTIDVHKGTVYYTSFHYKFIIISFIHKITSKHEYQHHCCNSVYQFLLRRSFLRKCNFDILYIWVTNRL